MKWVLKSVFAGALFISLPIWADEINGCPAGSYSIVLSPDGAALSLLFDQFTIESGRIAGSEIQRKVCRISSPLNLPANHSIGVYKVDYRGFAKLGAKQQAELDVQYFLGPRDNEHGRVFKRKIKGPKEGDYLFSETIGAGQMKRAGCGATARLDVGITLSLDAKLQTGQAMATLDTSDSAPAGALVFHLNLKKCP